MIPWFRSRRCSRRDPESPLEVAATLLLTVVVGLGLWWVGWAW